MELLIALGLVLLGLALLVVGGDVLLRGAVNLAVLFKMTPAIIGLTVVAAGTSIPELAVSMIAAIQKKPDLTVGNVVGSNIFNIAFIIGIASMIRPLSISGNTIKLEYPVLVIVTLMCLALGQDEKINWLDGVLFITVYIGFTAYMVVLVREQMSAQELREFGGEVSDITPTANPSMTGSILLVAAGSALLALGAQSTVEGAVQLAQFLGMSERVIGLTILGGGTGLPEVVTAIVASYRGRDDVAIGNIIGSNMFNILGILGISGLITDVHFSPATMNSDCWWMLGVTLFLFPLMYTGMRVNRFEGLLLMAVYITYVTLLVTQAAPVETPDTPTGANNGGKTAALNVERNQPFYSRNFCL